jgi:putative membrane protein
MWLYFFKSLHIVGFVSWFAGLFYLGRMFVYHREAFDQPEPAKSILTQQFIQMQWRVYKIICNPAMMITWTFGLAMLFLHGLEWLGANPWMHVKLLLLVLLTVYQIWSKRLISDLEKGIFRYSSFQFRLLNEVPTLFLLSIVLLAVYKNALDFLYAFLGIIGFMAALYFGAKAYRRARERQGS